MWWPARSRLRSGSRASRSRSRCARRTRARTPSSRSGSCSARRSSRRTTSRASPNAAPREDDGGIADVLPAAGRAARGSGLAAQLLRDLLVRDLRQGEHRSGPARRRSRCGTGPASSAATLAALPEALRARNGCSTARAACTPRALFDAGGGLGRDARGRRAPQRGRQGGRPSAMDGRLPLLEQVLLVSGARRSRSCRRRCLRASRSSPRCPRPRASRSASRASPA